MKCRIQIALILTLSTASIIGQKLPEKKTILSLFGAKTENLTGMTFKNPFTKKREGHKVTLV
jgi:hypothetical protein